MLLTHENHFKFGYNGEWFRQRQNDHEAFMVQFGRCKRNPDDLRSEHINAAKLIGQSTTDPIHVLYSGGADSEVTMLSFLAAKVPITAAILRFENALNYHDISYAIRFCERHQVPYQFHDLDIVKFLENRVMDYMDITKCTAPMTGAVMWLVDQIDGFPVIGQGECYLLRPELVKAKRVKQARVKSYMGKWFSEDEWALQESEMINAWYRFFLLRNREGVPGFHQYTPEQMLSYLLDPNVVAMMQANRQESSEASKLAIYQRHFDLPPRMKYTGYERVAEIINKHHTYLLDKYASSQNIFLTDVGLLTHNLKPRETK